MPNIVVVGSANVDLVAQVPRIPFPGETILSSGFFQAMGGKGANQAVAAARLGAEVMLIARLGDDAYADDCLNSYAQAGVKTHAIQRTPNTSTGIALIGVSEDGENAIIVVSGANMKLTPADVEQYADEIRAADVVLQQLEVPREANLAALAIAEEAGVPVILNPAPYRPIEDEILARLDVLTPNMTEAQHIIHDALGEPRMIAQQIRDKGVRNVIITLSGKGALAAWSDQDYATIPPLDVQPVDTTGAGDVFTAALAVARAEGQSLEEAARFATVAAGLSVTKRGAQPAMPTRAEVEAYLKTLN